MNPDTALDSCEVICVSRGRGLPRHLTSLLAVELLAAVRGLQLRAPLLPSPAGQAAIAAIAPFAGEPGPDRFLAPILEQARAVVAGRALRADIEAAVGRLL